MRHELRHSFICVSKGLDNETYAKVGFAGIFPLMQRNRYALRQ